MAAGKKQYVYRLMKATCSCGSSDFKQYLNVKEDHGVYFHDEESPLMNANDHVANENILTFGRCTSMANPNGAVGSLLASVAIPIIGGALMRKVAGVKCEPMTIVPWIRVDEDYYIDGAPALTIESELPCYYGGTIKIVLEKVEDDTDDSEESTEEEDDYDKTDQLPSEVQEKLDSFCDEEQTVVQSAGEDAIAAEEQAKQEYYDNLFQLATPQQEKKPMMDVPTFEVNFENPNVNGEVSFNEGVLEEYWNLNTGLK